jgi:hypothetical protein
MFHFAFPHPIISAMGDYAMKTPRAHPLSPDNRTKDPEPAARAKPERCHDTASLDHFCKA